jgi:hypothetical protein
MTDVLPADPKARRLAVMLWAIAAACGSAGVWWLSSYLDMLTSLAQIDRDAAIRLFRTRVLPALLAVAAVAVLAGGVLLRQGLQIARKRQFPVEGTRLVRETVRTTGATARTLGWVLAVAGFLLAAMPLVMVLLVFWLLRRA